MPIVKGEKRVSPEVALYRVRYLTPIEEDRAVTYRIQMLGEAEIKK